MLDTRHTATLTTQGWLPDGATVEAKVVMMPDGSARTRATARPRPPVVVITLPSEIDVTNDDKVRDALTQALRDAGAADAGAAVVIADASETTFCSCAGVRTLGRAHCATVAAGAQLRIAASPAVRRILELTRADLFLNVYPTVAAAQDGEQPRAGEASLPEIAPRQFGHNGVRLPGNRMSMRNRTATAFDVDGRS